jgi:hypothetical protein
VKGSSAENFVEGRHGQESRKRAKLGGWSGYLVKRVKVETMTSQVISPIIVITRDKRRQMSLIFEYRMGEQMPGLPAAFLAR